jgi:hypothetical protein
MKQASDCGRSKQKTCSFIRTPPMTPMHSPKSTWAWPGGWASGMKTSRDRMPLFGRRRLVSLQDRIDHWNQRPELRPLRSLGPHIAGRRRIPAHLGDRIPAQSENPRRLPVTIPAIEAMPTPFCFFFFCGLSLGTVPDGAGGFVPFTNSRVMPDGSLRPYDPAIDGLPPAYAAPLPEYSPYGPFPFPAPMPDPGQKSRSRL